MRRTTTAFLRPFRRPRPAGVLVVALLLSTSACAPSYAFAPDHEIGSARSACARRRDGRHRRHRPSIGAGFHDDVFDKNIAILRANDDDGDCIRIIGEWHHLFSSANDDDDDDATNRLEGSILLRRRNMLRSLMITTSATMTFPAFAEDQDASSSARRTAEEEPKECRNGGLISESAVPGAYEQSCMNLDERSFPLRTPGAGTITVYQGSNSAGGVAGRTGVAVWNSGILLTRLLDELRLSNGPSLFADRTVLELGCGAALASVAAARLGASSVLATDANPEVLALARRNVERNAVRTTGIGDDGAGWSDNAARTAELRWGYMDASEYEGAADFVIGSDLTYNSGSWVALAETMATVLRPGGIVVYLSLGHAGFNVGGEMGGFLSVVGNVGLRQLTRDDPEWKDAGLGERSAEVLAASVIAPEERAMVDSNGGVRVVFLGKKKVTRKG